MKLGYDYAAKNLAGKCKLKVERSDKVGDRIFIQGNDAAGLGAVYGGATVCAWYPITPSTSLAEAFTAHCKTFRVDPDHQEEQFRHRAGGGRDRRHRHGDRRRLERRARLHRDQSGPGISLMQEFFGLAYFAEVPAVIFDIQRGGPSTGMPTRTQQSDILLAAYASHGDTKHVLLFPEDPHEAFEFAALSFDLAERLQTPIFVMLDLDIGMNDWLCKPLTWDDARKYDRGKIMTAEELEAGKLFGRYLDVDGDAIPYRTLPAHASDARAPISRAARRATASRNTARKARSTSTTCSACCASSRPPRRWCPAPVRRDAKEKTQVRRDLLRLDLAGDGRGAGSAREAGHPSEHAAHPRLSVRRRGASSSSTRTTRCSWSSRTATRSCRS